MALFKSWLESADLFPQPQDLGNFISHAATVFLKAKQHTGKNAAHPSASNNTKLLAKEMGEMCELLHKIEAKLETKILSAELPLGKFEGKPTPSLGKNEYAHKFPSFSSVMKVLKTIGSHHLIDGEDSRAITERLNKLRILLDKA